MADTDEVPWAMVAAVADGLGVAVAVVGRGVTGAVRIALGEKRASGASDPDTWLKWVR